MQDKFSVEIELVNKLRRKLVDSGWSIVQLVCSGGQAHFSISYKKGGKLKNIFPDVVAFNNENVLIGEVKEKFDEGDYFKLLDLKSSNEGLKKLLKVVSMRSGITYGKEEIIFSLIHSQFSHRSLKDINQLVYDGNDFVFISAI